jgi:predicted PurR-regulated permease PerM
MPPPKLDLAEALHDLPRALQGRLFEAFGIGRQILRTLFGGIYTSILILVTAALFLLGREQIFEFVRTLLPERGGGGLEQLSVRLERRLSGVVRGQLTICLVNGLLTLIGLLLFRVEFPFVLAAQATGFSLIPIFGTFISSVPILIVALQGGLPIGLSMLAWILAVHALEAYLLNPRILGGAARIHPLLILFALVAGEHYFGLWGAFLAAPIAAIAVAAFEQAEAWADSGTA